MRLKVEYIPIDTLKPYDKNAKIHTPEQVEQIKKSITDFGMNDPIAIWGNDNIIVEGHGRLMACKELGYNEVPIIRLDGLTDEQRRAYTLVHNQTTMNTGFDIDILNEELENIDINMSDFGFEMPNIETDLDDDGWYGDERERTYDAYNLEAVDYDTLTNSFWQMPTIKRNDFIPDDLIGFNYAKTSENKKCGIHFYIDDYQFERVWNKPEEYTETLLDYECILSPDFSLYMDMPMPMKIWNVYRSRFIGNYYQSQGIKVIPTLSWAEPETFQFCFEGIQEGGVVSVSTIGVKRDSDAFKVWCDGMQAAIDKIKPSTILVYGGKLDFDYGNIDVRYFNNKVTERWKK